MPDRIRSWLESTLATSHTDTVAQQQEEEVLCSHVALSASEINSGGQILELAESRSIRSMWHDKSEDTKYIAHTFPRTLSLLKL